MFLNVALCSEYGRAESNKLKKKKKEQLPKESYTGEYGL